MIPPFPVLRYLKSPLLLGLLLLPAPVPALHRLIIKSFVNQTGLAALDSIPRQLNAVLEQGFMDYGVAIVDASGDSAAETPQAGGDVSVLDIRVEGEGAGLVRMTILAGPESRRYNKTYPYNPGESASRNATAMLIKIQSVFEENILGRIQVLSEPSGAGVIIDSLVRASTPWEAHLSAGNHRLHLFLDGFKPIDQDVTVMRGNNRFNFTFKTDTTEIRRPAFPAVRVKKDYSGYLLGAIFASGLFSLATQVLYVKTDRKYDDLVSPEKDEYDRLHENAERYIFCRNIGLTVLATSVGAYVLYQRYQ
jgi:hypothetical protein